ncbi:MAG TPA: nucleotide exchange factor GrpE, partial [Alteromonas macleodii]|nr:nucleotide exchange factor GrpE [Alteromonas macleodii]
MSDNRDVQAEQENTVDQTVQNAEEAQVEASQAEGVELDENAQRIYELETALSEAQATIKEQQDGVLRARADADNARRRAEGEVEKARKFALERFAGELLPVIDNLERAIEMTDGDNEAVKPLLEGVEMTHKTFLSTIEKFGLSLIDPQG